MPRHPSVAATSSSLSDRVYSPLAERARSLPGPIYPLHVGDTWLEPLPAARAEAQRTEDHPRLHNYSPVPGEPAPPAATQVFLPPPFWPLIRGILASRGCTPVEVPFYTRLPERAFDPEEALESRITERTAAIYVNSPNNPTGRG